MLSLIDRGNVVGIDGISTRFPAEPPSEPALRAGFVVSVVIHCLVAGIITTLVSVRPPRIARVAPATNRLVAIISVPVAPLEVPKLSLDAPPALKPVVTPVPAPEKPLAPLRPVETAALEAVPPRPTPNIVETARRSLPAPVAPVPTVGVFPDSTAAARIPKPAEHIEVAGFDAPLKQTPESKLGHATVGAFDSATNAGTRQFGSTNPATLKVAESGFGRSSSSPSPTQQARVVRDSGFGAAPSREQPKTAKPAEVKSAGFSNAVALDNSRRSDAPPAPPAVTPVEVLFKPVPVYTEEARKLRIEGDVILEVEFLSSGTLRVIRVIRGLGHGLDESATRAAAQIRFKPAQASGKAVDSRNTVSIVFRLA